MLEMIVFVTPPLNDLGDIKGDKKAGRQEDYPNSAWKRKYYTAFYANNPDIVFRHGYLTRTCVLLTFHLLNLLKPTEDQDHIRESVGKKVNAYALTITALAGYWLLHAPMRPMSQ